MKNPPRNQKIKTKRGQAVLVILLIMVVILTIGLSIISSSITDIKISQQQEEASRAFYVAESALEESLKLLEAASPGSIGGISYQVTKEELGGLEFLFPSPVEQGSSQTVWLVGHKNDGTLKLEEKYTGPISFYWSDQGSSDEPALMVSLIYKEGGVYKISRYNFDPVSTRRDSNKFASASFGSYSIGGKILKYSGSINIPGGIQPYFLRLTLVYNSTPQSLGVKVSGGKILPNQGFCFKSTAVVPESGVTRKLEQCKLWENLPEIFSWGLFSGGNLIK